MFLQLKQWQTLLPSFSLPWRIWSRTSWSSSGSTFPTRTSWKDSSTSPKVSWKMRAQLTSWREWWRAMAGRGHWRSPYTSWRKWARWSLPAVWKKHANKVYSFDFDNCVLINAFIQICFHQPVNKISLHYTFNLLTPRWFDYNDWGNDTGYL